MHLITLEAKEDHESRQAEADNQLRSMVFAQDLHHGLKLYEALYETPTEQSSDGFDYEEFVPESEEDVAQMMRDLQKLGL